MYLYLEGFRSEVSVTAGTLKLDADCMIVNVVLIVMIFITMPYFFLYRGAFLVDLVTHFFDN